MQCSISVLCFVLLQEFAWAEMLGCFRDYATCCKHVSCLQTMFANGKAVCKHCLEMAKLFANSVWKWQRCLQTVYANGLLSCRLTAATTERIGGFKSTAAAVTADVPGGSWPGGSQVRVRVPGQPACNLACGAFPAGASGAHAHVQECAAVAVCMACRSARAALRWPWDVAMARAAVDLQCTARFCPLV